MEAEALENGSICRWILTLQKYVICSVWLQRADRDSGGESAEVTMPSYGRRGSLPELLRLSGDARRVELFLSQL